jgi:hypothetical protein
MKLVGMDKNGLTNFRSVNGAGANHPFSLYLFWEPFSFPVVDCFFLCSRLFLRMLPGGRFRAAQGRARAASGGEPFEPGQVRVCDGVAPCILPLARLKPHKNGDDVADGRQASHADRLP